MIEQFF
jgi:hypothetical protein